MPPYRRLWIKHHGPVPVDELGRPYDIHHIDGDRTNNAIENLRAVSIQEHYDIHLAQGDHGACMLIARRLGMKHNMSGERHPLYGKTRSKETRRKIGASLRGKRLGQARSEETKRKIADTRKARRVPGHMRGKNHTQETKHKISMSKRGQTLDADARAKLSVTNKKLGIKPPSPVGMKWWKRGDVQMRAKECPGEGWVNGRLK